uniref:Protein CNPPD1 n=1 Tax=Simocephalus serrulatus TaxID=117539 RepID=A0A4Y7NNQ8_9CRUS|nr:EOG090X069C [Simocephalus serrulatus]SVE94237.1 EOG090X069C [Simocephalus serrulatus]
MKEKDKDTGRFFLSREVCPLFFSVTDGKIYGKISVKWSLKAPCPSSSRALTERLQKTLYYGSISKHQQQNLNSSLSLTDVMVEKFGESDSNLFLEKLCFEYAAELSREACLSPCSLVVALIYLERLCQNNPNFVSSIPSSKLFLISVMVASKFLNDEGEIDEVINSDWANSAKMELSELNQLERQFLQAIDWFLFVDDRDFADALARVEFRVAQRESLKRGWLTYTDLDVLARQKLLTDTWDVVYDLVINVSIACVTAYLASLVTLVGSAIVVSSLPWNNVGDISPSQSTPSQPMITPFVTTTSMPPNNNSSDLHPEDINFMDFEADSELSEISFHHSALDSDAFLKDFTAVTLGTFSHLPRPPYLKANETLVGSFVDSISYLQQSYCSLIDSVIRFRSNSFTQMPLCAIIA